MTLARTQAPTPAWMVAATVVLSATPTLALYVAFIFQWHALIFECLQGVPPATVAEFTLGTNGTPDNYDGMCMSSLPSLDGC